MQIILTVIIIILALYLIFDKGLSKKLSDTEKNEILPYKTRDDFLSDSERSFYFALKTFIDDKAVVCPKVALKDVFFVSKSVGKDYMKYFGKISQKHVDFLLCAKGSLKPLCGVELDDSSHFRAERAKRDEFVDNVFQSAGLKIVHIPLKAAYSAEDMKDIIYLLSVETPPIVAAETALSSEENTILCPKCGIPMVKRKASKGENKGKEFYGCTNYPRCKEIKDIVKV